MIDYVTYLLSREVQVNTGLRQGDALSPITFNLVLEKVIRMMNISPDEGVKLDGTSISVLAYANDIVLLGNNINTVKSMCERLITAVKRVGLQINEEKTE
ncbi:ribosome biogenesis protein TSR3 isoform X1 [Aphis craccivora]|uniref:Ribosome biogenesis protein TSR3 isoform X1 n=1 Tax=Aphis craccivora TaxID=307492 RepID=A0A6G0ZE76_APHCR|nr:ribosome biogenesis protein TSR3 isoform X1 [Aphis craccivora]